MATTKSTEETAVRVRANTFEENRTILRDIRKEVQDVRKFEELSLLFDRVNAECAARALKEKKKAVVLVASPEKVEKIKPVHYGPVPGISSGKWWGIQMDCSRDGIHEPFNESIHDGPFGAVSISTPNLNPYNDADLGDIFTFTSGEYSLSNKAKDPLVLSLKNKVPVRVVRSYSLSNAYAPKTGYRYDGLYTVVDYWIGLSNEGKKFHKFVLTRVIDQELAPWIGKTRRLYASIPPLTRSRSSNVNKKDSKVSKKLKFVYKKVEKEPKESKASAIVSRQVFDKRDSSPKSVSSTDSGCSTSCPSKLCNTNLSIRTNLYNSSQQMQDVKKPTMTFCKIFKPNQLVQLPHKSTQEIEKLARETLISECADRKLKKVTWADSCNSALTIGKSTVGNGFQYSGSDVVDGYSPTSPKKSVLKCNNISEQTRNIFPDSPSTKTYFSTMCEDESMDEISSSIDSLAPDKLVNAIVKEKYHPMAKLLIGNMIGSENQESSVISAYNALTSEVPKEDSPSKSKENKHRNIYIKNSPRKNGMLKRQRREIANLTIDAKFDVKSRGSLRHRRLQNASKMHILKSDMSKRKILNARRLQSKNLKKEIIKELKPKKPENRKAETEKVEKRSKLVTRWTQCNLLAAPTIERFSQTDESLYEATNREIKVEEIIDLDEIKEEPCEVESPTDDLEPDTSCNERSGLANLTGSAFAAVSLNDAERIERLRSINFIPIGSCSPTEEEESSRPQVDEEYNKYASEENEVVGYMNEQLHYEDIEDEEMPRQTRKKPRRKKLLTPKPVEFLTEEDFDRPWHGWKGIAIDGEIQWTGY